MLPDSPYCKENYSYRITPLEIMKERTEKLEETAKVIKLNNDIQTMATAIVKRDFIIKERLGIVLPNPFESRD